MKRAAALVIVLAWTLAYATGPKGHATLKFLVVKQSNGKPVKNASVVLHPVHHNGDQDRGGLELKTSPEGMASVDGIPYGKLRIQVLAPHFKTFGADYDISQPEQEFTIKLEVPADQVTIYK